MKNDTTYSDASIMAFIKTMAQPNGLRAENENPDTARFLDTLTDMLQKRKTRKDPNP